MERAADFAIASTALSRRPTAAEDAAQHPSQRTAARRLGGSSLGLAFRLFLCRRCLRSLLGTRLRISWADSRSTVLS